MSQKKEARKLIEVLLKQQRLQRPKGQNPLDGIEWGGLPPELHDRVFKPKHKGDSLSDLLNSINEKKDNPELDVDADVDADVELQPELVKSRKIEKQAVEIKQNFLDDDKLSPEDNLLERKPGIYQRFKAHFFDVFGFLNKYYEIRAITVVTFCIFSLVVVGLSFLVGKGMGNPYVIGVNTYYGPPNQLQRSTIQNQMDNSTLKYSKPEVSSLAKKKQQPHIPSGKIIPAYTIRLAGSTSKSARKELTDAAVYLRGKGYESSIYFIKGSGQYVLTLGCFQTKKAVYKDFPILKEELGKLSIPNVINNSDIYIWAPEGNKQVYP